jgi:predicted nucleic acid-binding protein
MYLVGYDHPLKFLSQQLLQRHIVQGDKLVTDVAVYQEILHRYTAIQRPAAIDDAFQALSAIVDSIFPVDFTDVETARRILASQNGVSARDALHLATMERHRVAEILSFDAGFDQYPGVKRIFR